MPNSDLLLILWQLLLTLGLAVAGVFGVQFIARQITRHLNKTKTPIAPEQLARLHTLISVGKNTAYVTIVLVTLLILLRLSNLDIMPLITSAGVIGLAITLGAQTLIRDCISGVLILVENQFTVADVIRVGGLTGTVESITLRATYLRDGEGQLHIIPNGEIRILTNLSAEWSVANVTLNIAMDADMDLVEQTLNEAATQTQQDSKLQGLLLSPPQVNVWAGLSDWAKLVQLSAKTAPGQQGAVQTALRRNAILALQRAGIPLAVSLPTYSSSSK